MSGVLCFTGTRVPDQNLFDYLEGSSSLEDFLEDFPSVQRAAAVAVLEAARAACWPMRLLPHQQNLRTLPVAVVILGAVSNELLSLVPLMQGWRRLLLDYNPEAPFTPRFSACAKTSTNSATEFIVILLHDRL